MQITGTVSDTRYGGQNAEKIVSKPSVHVCRCWNENVLERNHPIDLYRPKATKDSVLALLERITGFKCDINDGLSSKVCYVLYLAWFFSLGVIC